MKKTVTILLIITTFLTGCNTKSEISSSNSNESNTIFINSDSDYYKNGCVYGNETTMFFDFDTLKQSPLCARPNCTHSNSDCLAKETGDTPIFYNDYIYYLKSNYGAVRETAEGSEFYIDSALYRASLDTSETEVVCEFHDCVPLQVWKGLVLNGSNLYFTGDDCNPVKDDLHLSSPTEFMDFSDQTEQASQH